jgi:hypothetical protein
MMIEKNKKVTIDLNTEDTDRFGYVPPNSMMTPDDLEERGYVPPAIERQPISSDSGSSTDSSPDQDQQAEEQSMSDRDRDGDTSHPDDAQRQETPRPERNPKEGYVPPNIPEYSIPHPPEEDDDE